MKDLCFYGNPVLRKKCKEVEEITPFVKKVIQEMIDSVMNHEGAGIAAPQIGYDLRIFVNMFSEKVDKEGYPYMLDEPEVFINPEITRFSKRKIVKPEGCLSIPGFRGDVERAYDVDITYMDIEGNTQVKFKKKKWVARCLQHELDHLDGILFIDHMDDRDKLKYQGVLLSLEKKSQERLNKSTDLKGF